MEVEVTIEEDPFRDKRNFKEFAEIWVSRNEEIEALAIKRKPSDRQQAKKMLADIKWDIIGGLKHGKTKDGMLKTKYGIEISSKTYFRYKKMLTKTPEGIEYAQRLRKGVITDWEEFLQSSEWKKFKRSKIGKKPATLQRYTDTIRKFVQWSNFKQPSSWTEDDIRDWLVFLKVDHRPQLKIGTCREYMVAMRQFIKYGIRNTKLHDALPVDIAGEKPKPVDVTYLKPEELAKTLKYCPKRTGEKGERLNLMDRAMLLFLMISGCRRGERNTPKKIEKYKEQGITEIKRMELGLIGARLDNVNWESRVIMMYEKMKATWYVKLYPQCYEAIVEYLLVRFKWTMDKFKAEAKKGIEGYLFGVSGHYLDELFKAILKNAEKNDDPITGTHVRLGNVKLGIGRDIPKDRKFSPHIYRKSFAQNLLANGITLEVISDMQVGWRDLSTLKKYYGTTPEELKDKAHSIALTYLPKG